MAKTLNDFSDSLDEVKGHWFKYYDKDGSLYGEFILLGKNATGNNAVFIDTLQRHGARSTVDLTISAFGHLAELIEDRDPAWTIDQVRAYENN